MKFFRKQTNWSTLALLSIVPLVPGVSFAMTPELNSVLPALNNAKQAAENSQACPGTPTDQPGCQACTQHLSNVFNQLDKSVAGAIQAYSGATAAGVTSAAQTGAAATVVGAQKTQTTGAEITSGNGSQSNAARAKIAKDAAAAFQKCQSEATGGACASAKNIQSAQQVAEACGQGAGQASTVAEANGKAGSTLGEMAGALGQAAQALGPLMQQMMQGQAAGADPSNPYGSTVSKPAPLASAKLSASNPAAGGSVGFGSGASTGMEGANAASGYAPAYQARSFQAEPTLASSLGGSDPGSTGSAGSGGASSTGASSMGGAGGFGSKDSSGASKMGEKGSGILDPNNFEMPSGGSSGGRPFLGLKSKSLSMDDGSSGVDTSSSFANELGLDEEGRDLASTDELGSDIHGEESGTLFDAIRSKYSEIKKRGNI